MKSNRADEMPPVMRGVPLTSADDQSHQQSRQDISSAKSRRPRRSRSKRGIARTDVKYSQICFRIEEDRHVKLRAALMLERKEAGEFMDELLRKAGH